MKYWIITDTHFNHERMKEFGRPDDFEEKIASSLKRLTEEDVLIHLGDVCIGKDEEVHNKYIIPIKSKKWLIAGNHDKKSYSWYLEHGWDFVSESVLFYFRGKKILFTHAPAPDGNYDINIHGHLHDGEHRPEYDGKKHEKQKLIALEKMGYRCFSIEEILNN